jgi:GxxExxY protein
MDATIIYREESVEIVGKCMEIHTTLGHGFSELVYKDALEIIFTHDGIF